MIPKMKMLKHFYDWVATEKGGPGSGNHGHAGRPGEVGGSAPKSGVPVWLGGSSGGAAVIIDKGIYQMSNHYPPLIEAGVLGENERFAKGTTLEQVFDHTRRKIREFDTERIVFFDSKGNVYYSKVGEKSEINFDDEEIEWIKKIPGSITIHNHPGEYFYEKDILDTFPDFVRYGNSFSDSDNYFQWKSHNKIMQAVTRKYGAVYTMEMKDGLIDAINKLDYLALNYDKVIGLAEHCVTEINFKQNINRFPLAFLESIHSHARCVVLSRFKPDWFEYTATDIDGNPLDYSDNGTTPGLPKFDFEGLVNDALALVKDRVRSI